MTDLTQIIQASTFLPSNRQIRARNAFYQKNPGDLPPDLTPALCVEMGAPGTILKWWTTAGFSEWWTNPSWEKEEAHRIMLQAMQAISGILSETRDSDTAIKAAKEAREIYTKLNVTSDKKFADESISEMSRDQLADYIRRNTALTAVK